MTKRIPAMAARKNFGEILESVFYRGDEVIVERAGKPMGVLIPMAQYHKLERQRTDALARMEALWAAAPAAEDPEAAGSDILEETEAVRHGPSTEDPMQSPSAEDPMRGAPVGAAGQ